MSELNIKEVKVHRTLEGTIFEIVCAVILIVVWVLALTTRMFSGPEIQGKHIGIISLTVATVVLLAGAYFPRWINAGQELQNIRQVEIAIRMTRTLAVELAAFCLLMVVFTSRENIIDAIHIGFTVSLIATVAIYNAFIYGARS